MKILTLIRYTAAIASGLTIGLGSKWLLQSMGADAAFVKNEDENQLLFSDVVCYFTVAIGRQFANYLMQRACYREVTLQGENSLELQTRVVDRDGYARLNQPSSNTVMNELIEHNAGCCLKNCSTSRVLPVLLAGGVGTGFKLVMVLVNTSEIPLWSAGGKHFLNLEDGFYLSSVTIFDCVMKEVFDKCQLSSTCLSIWNRCRRGRESDVTPSTNEMHFSIEGLEVFHL